MTKRQGQQVRKRILTKMYFDKVILARHISLEDLRTGFPSHAKGDVEKELKKLIKENLVLQHPTSYGMQFALNHNEIERIQGEIG